MKFRKWIKYIILVVALVMIIAGVMTGESQTVYSKAIRICFECIGIG